jgi:hypothetical protein
VDYGEQPDPGGLFLTDIWEPIPGQLNVLWSRNVELPRLYGSVDGGPWQRVYDSHEYTGYGLKADFSFYPLFDADLPLRLVVDLSSLEPGRAYEIEVRYIFGGVSVDGLLVDLTGAVPEYKLLDGDRAGHNRREQTLPPVDGPHNNPVPDPPGKVSSDSNDGGGSVSGGKNPGENIPYNTIAVGPYAVSQLSAEAGTLLLAERVPLVSYEDNSVEPEGNVAGVNYASNQPGVSYRAAAVPLLAGVMPEVFLAESLDTLVFAAAPALGTVDIAARTGNSAGEGPGYFYLLLITGLLGFISLGVWRSAAKKRMNSS